MSKKEQHNKLVQDLVREFKATAITSDKVNEKTMDPPKLLELYKKQFKKRGEIAEHAIRTLATAIDKAEIVMEGKISGLESIQKKLTVTNLKATPRQTAELSRLGGDKDLATVSISIRTLQQNLPGMEDE